MKRILKTKHKLIGFIGIILVLDLVLVGALMKPVNADRKTEDYDAAAEISTSLNVAAMQAKLTVEDESNAVIKSGKAEPRSGWILWRLWKVRFSPTELPTAGIIRHLHMNLR